MPVFPPVFDVIDTRPRGVDESEFGFVSPDECFDDRFRVGAAWRRIDMNVMHGAICATVGGRCDQLTDLALKVVSRETARGHDDDLLAVFLLEQMTGQSIAAGASGRTCDHSATFAARRRSTMRTRSACAARISRRTDSAVACPGA